MDSLPPITGWRPGQSGNPSGRPRTFYKLADRIRKRSNWGGRLVTFAFKVMDAKIPGVQMQHRMDALYWLADRGWGKPTQSVELATSEGHHPTFSIGVLNILEGNGVAGQLQVAAVEAIKQASQAPQKLLPPK
jgi:hypothetical protein